MWIALGMCLNTAERSSRGSATQCHTQIKIWSSDIKAFPQRCLYLHGTSLNCCMAHSRVKWKEFIIAVHYELKISLFPLLSGCGSVCCDDHKAVHLFTMESKQRFPGCPWLPPYTHTSVDLPSWTHLHCFFICFHNLTAGPKVFIFYWWALIMHSPTAHSPIIWSLGLTASINSHLPKCKMYSPLGKFTALCSTWTCRRHKKRSLVSTFLYSRPIQ